MAATIDPTERFQRGFVLGPILAALFLAVLAIYSQVFADWLTPHQPLEESPTQ